MICPEEQLMRFISPDGELHFHHVIIHLGGRFERIFTTLDCARKDPKALVIIASEASPSQIRDMWQKEQLPHIVFNYDSWDTLTNFTELRWMLEVLHPGRITVVTDQYHAKRAQMLADWVYEWPVGFTVHETQEQVAPETRRRFFVDYLRGAVYALTKFVVYNPLHKRKVWPIIQRYAEGLT